MGRGVVFPQTLKKSESFTNVLNAFDWVDAFKAKLSKFDVLSQILDVQCQILDVGY